MRQLFTRFLFVSLLFVSYFAVAQTTTVENHSNNVLSQMTEFYKMGIDEKLYLQLDKPYYSSGDQIWFKGYLRNAVTHMPIERSNYIYVELINRDDKLISRVKVKRDSTGFNGYITLDPEMKPDDYTLKAYSRWMINKGEDFFYTRSVKIISPIPPFAGAEVPEPKLTRREKKEEAVKVAAQLQYSVQFFPEGGALLPGALQMIAYKSVAQDGLSIEVFGEIYNSKNELIKEFKTTNKGMGSIAFVAEAGEKYYAKTMASNGVEAQFDLPAVESEGAVVNARRSGERLLYHARATSNQTLSGAYVIIHSHGRIISVSDITSNKVKVIPMSQLYEGVNAITLLSGEHKVLSERLVFKRPEKSPSFTFATGRSNYGRREKATVKMNIKDSFGAPATGQYGISVTDDSSIEFNAEDENIFSSLLLTSDLQGHIESPGLYFSGDLVEADRNIDLLLLTQGWKRFDFEKILTGEIEQPTLQYEEDAEISGHVKGVFGNDARQPKIIVMCPKKNFFDVFDLDTSSRFRLSGLDIPDSTSYVIQARTRKGNNTLVLEIDPEPFPEVKSSTLPRAENAYVPVAFVNQSQEKFFYDGGMNLIDIDAVYVTAQTTSSYGVSTHATDREELEYLIAMPITSIIRTYPSMEVTDEGVFYRGSRVTARFIIDGMDADFEDLEYITSEDLESINFLSGIDAAVYSDSAGGVFLIELRKTFTNAEQAMTPGIANVTNLGYQKTARLYQPEYNVPSLKANLPPDYRTTIFWDGSLLPDENGNIEFGFYTADKATTYTVTVEGVTNEGEIGRATSKVNRTADR